MTNLTDKWKKGELPDNHHYYFKLPKSKEYEVGNTFCLKTLRWCKNGDKIQIIREVPSYKEFITTISENDILRQENTKLKTENKWYSEQLNEAVKEEGQLKEQLKECELWFTGVVGNMNDKNCGEHNRNLPIGNFEHIFKVFSQKINQVLGEE